MRITVVFAVVTLCVGCKPANQESVRTVAAIEIPLKSDADRNDLVTLLRREAIAVGNLHVDNVTERWRRFEAQNGATLPGGRGTIFVGVWRGTNDDQPIADVNDMGHPGRAWLTFAKGQDVARSTNFRERLLADVNRRWPEAKSLPILPSGALPFADDLVLTTNGYGISAASASRYQLPRSSPLIVNH